MKMATWMIEWRYQDQSKAKLKDLENNLFLNSFFNVSFGYSFNSNLSRTQLYTIRGPNPMRERGPWAPPGDPKF